MPRSWCSGIRPSTERGSELIEETHACPRCGNVESRRVALARLAPVPAAGIGGLPAPCQLSGPRTPRRTELSATFESLFAACAASAFGVAMRLTRNQADAEDLVQDAAFLAYRAFASFEPGTNFRAWFSRS